jgi:hypothetical protein
VERGIGPDPLLALQTRVADVRCIDIVNLPPMSSTAATAPSSTCTSFSSGSG